MSLAYRSLWKATGARSTSVQWFGGRVSLHFLVKEQKRKSWGRLTVASLQAAAISTAFLGQRRHLAGSIETAGCREYFRN